MDFLLYSSANCLAAEARERERDEVITRTRMGSGAHFGGAIFSQCFSISSVFMGLNTWIVSEV